MELDLEREVAEAYRQYASAVLACARTLASDADEARDAVQETFLRYFMERRYGRQIEHPRAWLMRVACNYLLGRRKSAALAREDVVELEQLAGSADDPEALATLAQRAREIRTRLSGREWDCLRLRTEGLSYAEIGVRLGVRQGTIGALLSRVHEKLRWPPGREGIIGAGTAKAVHFLFLGDAAWATSIEID
jgi:RNA polymerase sigma factor (sigma-70 family)